MSNPCQILRRLACIAIVMFVGTDAAIAAGPPATPGCAVPADLLQDDPPLPNTAARLKSDGPLTIVAIGGGSTAGRAAGSADLAYPKRLQEALSLRHPKIKVIVINKGLPRQTAQDMVERFQKEVLSQSPNLVIWETGTVDAVRGIDTGDFARTLQEGIDLLRSKPTDIILIDMQYSRSTATIINFDPYIEAMRRVADLNDVFMFRRYDIMKYWRDIGAFNFDDVPKPEQAKMAVQVYDCIAKRLADAIDLDIH